MKQTVKRILAWLMVLTLCLSLLPGIALADLVDYRTGTSSYDDDVFENVVINWGVRGTNATFLSPMAEAYYETNNVSYDSLSSLSGSSDTADMTGTELYQALKALLLSTHTNEVSYDETRGLYAFADCQRGDLSTLSCFYSGKILGPWDSGSTWNREHTWPQSKGMKDDEEDDENDLVMLRPASSSTNSSRGNKAYGEGDTTKYYDPNSESGGTLNVRGDVARSLLYGFLRWENTSYMWGADGVIQSPELLLRWMREDPVDTWEMGRNDSVESVTGVRNVFIDYPELAFILLGQEVPTDMVTPSGMAIDAGLIYTITATSNNEAWGEAFVSGSTINAAPKTGYEVQGYTLISGEATVNRSGNAFSVTAASDCTIQINFSELDGYDVRFHENGTVTDTQVVFAGDSIPLPEASGEAPEGYTFLGWITNEISATTQKPAAICNPGTYVTIHDNTDYYALYSFLEEGTTGGSSYQLYSGEITEGNYLITYENGALKASITNSRLDFSMVTPVNGIVADPDASLIWKIAFNGDYVTLYNESTGKYAAGTGVKNKAKLETAVTDNSRWTPSGTETYEFVNLANQTAGVNSNLRRNAENGFAPYSTQTGGALTLYKQSNTIVYYATDATVCEHANTLEVEAVAPNCTQSGYTAGVRCGDCNAWISGHEVIEALGHSYNVTETAPTCTEKGKAVYTCTVCGSGYSETLPATGHTYEEGICVDCGADDPNYGIPTGTYQLVTSLEDITAGGQFVIAVNNEGSWLALGTSIASGKIAGVGVTVEDNTVTSEEPPVWTIEAAEDGVSLNVNGQYIKWSSGTSFSSLKTPYTWIPERNETTGGIRLIASTTVNETSVRGIIYRLSTNTFGPYATSNETNADYIVDLQLFKYIVEGAEDCEHSYTEAITTLPGCETEGVKTFTCTGCGIRYTESIPATGHTEQPVSGTAPTCTESGLTDGVICTVCGKGVVPQGYIPATGHSYENGICTVCGAEDTGTAAPVTGYVLVTDLNDVLSGGQFVIAVNNAGSWQAVGPFASKIDGMDITVDNGLVTIANPPVWTIEAVNGGVALSMNGSYLGWAGSTNFGSQDTPYAWALEECEAGGFELIASTSLDQTTVRSMLYYVTYDRFGPYARSNGSKPEYVAELQLFKYQEAESSDCEHSYSEEITTEPGCETTGVKTFTCELCGSHYTESIPAVGHTEQTVAGTAPTCTESGLTDGTVCSVCGEEVVPQGYIPATGHSYEDGVCTVCGAEDTGEVPPVTGYVLVTDLSQITAGGEFVIAVNNAGSWKAMGPAANKIDGVDITVTNNLVTSANPPVWTVEAAEGGVALSMDGSYLGWVEKTNFASQDSSYIWSLEQGEAGGFRLIASTSLSGTARGILFYIDYNRFGPYACSNGTKEEYNAELMLFKYQEAESGDCEHSYAEEITTAPGCETEGVKTFTCDLCGDSYTESIPATGHTEQIIPGTAPTCTETGLTDGVKCSVCDETLTAQEEIPATGHSYEAVVTEPTATEQGYTTYTCTVCGDSYVDDYTDALGLTISGGFTTFADDSTTIEVLSDGAVIASVAVSGKTGSYELTGIAPGSYTLRISKQNHVTREYTVTLEAENLTQDVKIHLIGDVTGDGRVNVGDVSRIYSHAKKSITLTDYEFLCADVTGDNRVNVGDASRVYSHAKKINPLF